MGFAQSNASRELAGTRIVAQARRDVGIQEKSWRNDNPLFDYYRVLGGNPNHASAKGWRDAYCAYGVYAWHRQAGLNPKVTAIGRALSWSYHPSKIRLGGRAQPGDIAKLQPGWVMGFRFSSNHVGVIEAPYALYAQTIEANTSLSNSVGHYGNKNEGVIRKIRFYKDAAWATDWRGSAATDSSTAFTLRTKLLMIPRKR